MRRVDPLDHLPRTLEPALAGEPELEEALAVEAAIPLPIEKTLVRSRRVTLLSSGAVAGPPITPPVTPPTTFQNTLPAVIGLRVREQPTGGRYAPRGIGETRRET